MAEKVALYAKLNELERHAADRDKMAARVKEVEEKVRHESGARSVEPWVVSHMPSPSLATRLESSVLFVCLKEWIVSSSLDRGGIT